MHLFLQYRGRQINSNIGILNKWGGSYWPNFLLNWLAFELEQLLVRVSPGSRTLYVGPLGEHLALNTHSGRRFRQAVETLFLPVHLQQLHVYMPPLDEGYIVLEVVTRSSYDTHEV